MCGRFALIDQLKKVLAGVLPADRIPGAPACFNLAPGMPIPILKCDRHQQITVDLMQWGLVPHWAKDIALAPKLINARAETAAAKPAFRGPWRHHRGLIPASGFYEWQKQSGGQKQPYFISGQDEKPLFFAALWDEWAAPSGETLYSCTVLTCAANETLKPLHHRMPVLLSPDQFDHWLNPRTAPRDLQQMMRPAGGQHLKTRPITDYVNDVRHDDPRCIAPAEITGPIQGALF